MKNLNRRNFIHKSALCLAGTVVGTSGLVNLSFSPASNAMVDEVALGKTGMAVPRLALGTG